MATHHANIRDWLTLIQAEYDEIPGLSLTKAQVQRLWGLDDVTCDALLEALEAAKFLMRTAKNTYVRAGPEPQKTWSTRRDGSS
jgi:hypothetical protein